MAAPTLTDVQNYLGGVSETSFTTAEITQALAAETVAQASICTIPTPFPADLAEALLRRVARNLALRSNLIGLPEGDAGISGPSFIPGRDSLVRMYEAPYRKWVVG